MQRKEELFSSCVLAANHSPGTKKGRKKPITASVFVFRSQCLLPVPVRPQDRKEQPQQTKKDNVAFLPHFLIMSGKKFWISEALLASLLRTGQGASPRKQAGLEQERREVVSDRTNGSKT